jgi:hypothetical protein
MRFSQEEVRLTDEKAAVTCLMIKGFAQEEEVCPTKRGAP